MASYGKVLHETCSSMVLDTEFYLFYEPDIMHGQMLSDTWIPIFAGISQCLKLENSAALIRGNAT